MPCVPVNGRPDSPSSGSFNPRHAKYSCCFESLHAKKGSGLIALLHITVALLFLVYIIKSLHSPHKSAIEGAFQIIIIFVVLTANFIFLIGLRIEHRHLVSFFICFHLLKLIILFIIFLLLILGYKALLFRDEPTRTPGRIPIDEELLIVAQIFSVLFVLILEVCFLTVFLKSNRYLNDKYHFNGSESAAEV